MLPELLSTLALAGTGPADCPVLPRESRPPTRFEWAIEGREEFGFRADRSYVRKLLRRPGVDSFDYMPVTAREKEHVRQYYRLRLGRPVTRYLRERPGLSGGVTLESGWPGAPYLLLRLTEDPALHEAALRELAKFPDDLRLVQVAHSTRELRQVQDAVDFDAHEADGFHVMGAYTATERGRVVVELITKRTDGEAFFQAAYGPLVTTRVTDTELTHEECADLFGYRLSDGGRRLQLTYEAGGGADFVRVVASESRKRVRVGVVIEVFNGARTADSRPLRRTVELERPLGDRIVVNDLDGKRLRPLPRSWPFAPRR